MRGFKKIPALNPNRFPIKDDIAGIARDPLIRACCPNNTNAGFELAGIVTLSIDVMLIKLIGNEPVVARDKLPHLSIMLGQADLPRRC